ncbi:MAG: 8-hydroxy-5-deazaflavin:NADPH oxidoreductase [Mycobacterium sp.]|nr:8-hydroxy-5-deazaflavin:NADPH oxidoreductase [Mycobacterium sp.]
MFAKIGVIGSGAVGRAVATRAVAAGIPVILSNSRGPDTLTAVVDELGAAASAGTVAEAADADLVVIAIPFIKIPDLASEVPHWSGRLVVDASNQFAQYEPTYSGRVDLGDETGSEWVARHLPGATVIKAFNAMYAVYIEADPRHHDGRQVLFFAGDDDAINAEFAEFGEALGFAPVLLGGLREGGRLMQLDGPLSALHVVKQD